MVGGYRAGHGGTQGLDSVDCCSRRSMLEDYTKPWEVGMEFLRWGKKVGSAFITWMFCTEFSVGDTRNSPDLPLMRRMALPREDLAPCLLLAWLQNTG